MPIDPSSMSDEEFKAIVRRWLCGLVALKKPLTGPTIFMCLLMVFGDPSLADDSGEISTDGHPVWERMIAALRALEADGEIDADWTGCQSFSPVRWKLDDLRKELRLPERRLVRLGEIDTRLVSMIVVERVGGVVLKRVGTAGAFARTPLVGGSQVDIIFSHEGFVFAVPDGETERLESNSYFDGAKWRLEEQAGLRPPGSRP